MSMTRPFSWQYQGHSHEIDASALATRADVAVTSISMPPTALSSLFLAEIDAMDPGARRIGQCIASDWTRKTAASAAGECVEELSRGAEPNGAVLSCSIDAC